MNACGVCSDRVRVATQAGGPQALEPGTVEVVTCMTYDLL